MPGTVVTTCAPQTSKWPAHSTILHDASGGLRSRVRRFESYWGHFFEQTSERSISARVSDLHLYKSATNITARDTPGRPDL
jgi:hypothetical protein